MEMVYEIVIKGHIKETLFEELTVIIQPNFETLIRGKYADQPAVYGALRKISDLGLELISVKRIDEI